MTGANEKGSTDKALSAQDLAMSAAPRPDQVFNMVPIIVGGLILSMALGALGFTSWFIRRERQPVKLGISGGRDRSQESE